MCGAERRNSSFQRRVVTQSQKSAVSLPGACCETLHSWAVIAGLDPAIPRIWRGPRHIERDGRVKPGHDHFAQIEQNSRPR